MGAQGCGGGWWGGGPPTLGEAELPSWRAGVVRSPSAERQLVLSAPACPSHVSAAHVFFTQSLIFSVLVNKTLFPSQTRPHSYPTAAAWPAAWCPLSASVLARLLHLGLQPVTSRDCRPPLHACSCSFVAQQALTEPCSGQGVPL